ncbi:MAG: TIGR01212 family radical SAM protein [Parachlamydiales bacterium]|nr:TIGR01212 family radical SAM protein [Parachlamydiales bacterium]
MPLYRSFHESMRNLFGCRVYKISVDAGFDCPNRDGTKSSGGCLFCDARGSSSRTHQEGTSLQEQILKNIAVRKQRYKGEKFIIYFQSFTNTYAPIEVLQEKYDTALKTHPDIVGISIATRPDCVDEEKLDLIASYQKTFPYVCIEYGLQTIHDTTLQKINRHENFSDFVHALELSKKRTISTCAHIIIGLPEEGRQEILETADAMAQYALDGVKIHVLVAMKNTPLADYYQQGLWKPLSFSASISLICDFIEHLPSECVIHRIAGNGHPQHLIAPLWMKEKKQEIIPEVIKEFTKRSTHQGSHCLFFTSL